MYAVGWIQFQDSGDKEAFPVHYQPENEPQDKRSLGSHKARGPRLHSGILGNLCYFTSEHCHDGTSSGFCWKHVSKPEGVTEHFPEGCRFRTYKFAQKENSGGRREGLPEVLNQGVGRACDKLMEDNLVMSIGNEFVPKGELRRAPGKASRGVEPGSWQSM
ncbi:hypothetical protein T265_05998 [Opisthorchis viverrini]|uniref:Uncharacterized protein n=1 Tax=Opisthorchis viverrini TaxID=6198 RepID=A0A074ZM73_OPIVI|nr:hypothetical protein T265_05998 [Opisthorchis viverrini]KER26867.1 hypothetical protein T265_05998 [Opisthorchis viverrini]